MSMLNIGSSRAVILFYGLAIKFPIIHFILAGKRLLKLVLSFDIKRWRHCFRMELRYGYDSYAYSTFSRILFRGIFHNWLEFVFYLKNRTNPCLAKTYFSLLGLINIQERVEILECKGAGFADKIDELTDNMTFQNSHTLRNPENFGYRRGLFKIVDYGSPRVQEVLIKYGKEISELKLKNQDHKE